MKITFITTQINLITGGGANLSSHLKARSMAELGHEVKILTLFPEKNSFDDALLYTVIKLPTRFKNWMALQIKILFVLRKYQRVSDMFAFEGEHFIWGAGLYRLLGGKTPVLMHFNGFIFAIFEHGALYKLDKKPKRSLKTKLSHGFRKYFEILLGPFLANHIDHFTATTPLIRDWFIKFGLKPGKITVLTDFADLLFFSKDTERINLPKNMFNILHAGRLVPEKGIDTLLLAIKDIAKKKNILLHIIGTGREKNNLQELTQKLNLQNNVIFYPNWMTKEELNRFYHSADLFVHPSRWPEPFGIIIASAMIAGLPIIIPETSGITYAVRNSGVTFKNGDSTDLREKIEILIDNPSLRKELSIKAKKIAFQLDYRNSIKKLDELLRGLVIKNKSKN